MHAISRFFAWCGQHRIGQLADIEPLHIAAYIERLGTDFEKPTIKQHLAAIRMLFDWLVTGHVVAVNPATSVRGPKHVVRRVLSRLAPRQGWWLREIRFPRIAPGGEADCGGMRGLLLGGGDRAAGCDGTRLSSVSVPGLWQAVQRTD
jgi:hypothetical protein